jgi:hypothetical protein
MIAFAAEGAHITKAKLALLKVQNAVLFPLMTLMMAVAVLFFLYGAYEFVLNADSEEGQTKGKTHMLYGIIGLIVMLSAYAIIQIATGTIGCDATNLDACGGRL